MDNEHIALKVLAKLTGVDADAIEPEMELSGELGIDSPKALQLLVELEDKLGIEVSDDAAARMNTVQDVLNFLDRKV